MDRRRLILAAGGLAPLGSRAFGSEPSPQAPAAPQPMKMPLSAPYEPFFQGIREGHYLTALTIAEEYSRKGGRASKDAVAQAYGMIGEERLALPAAERFSGRRAPTPDAQTAATAALVGAHVVPAIEELAQRVIGKRLVLINEAHHVSRHRAFTGLLASRLRRDGFSWFAAEAFQPPISDFTKGGPLTHKMGTYINDPVFAEALRSMRDLKYRFVAYDYPEGAWPNDPVKAGRAREDEGARHIVEQVFEKDPQARLLVHVGYGHLQKHSTNAFGLPVETVAQRIQARTGIEPFCIDQTACTPASTPELDNPYLAQVLSRLAPSEPALVRTSDGAPFRSGDADELVFHPRVADAAGRPGWRSSRNVKPVAFDPAIALKQQCRLVHAYAAGEAASQTIPADVLVLDGAYAGGSLMLPPGRYLLKGERADGLIDLGEVRA